MYEPKLISAHGEHNEDCDVMTESREFECEGSLTFMENWAHMKYPSRRCQHEHDCCGHWYPASPSVTQISINRFMVVQTYHLNI